ncbi:DUF2335 domain-containing protein [Flavobacterium columnare]|uniref:Uncharacterized protein n=2 Tax=Flavobacterium TaxID=237 RepID=A0A2D0AI98_9FLAO|nr:MULTISPECIES: DUF2335 domain-containing protein [Flavobacterium]OWP82865.1 hypothetical protein BWK59_13580 [Flavobacterium davisii]RVU91949.1 DUF2335 domain-containing protein [Flavobacterium columnare]
MNKQKNYKENKNQGLEHSKGKLLLSQTYEGQLPSPEMMEKYNQLDPTFANRILIMTEKEQIHQHSIDKRSQFGILFSMIIGMFFAFSSVLVISYLVYLCITKDYPKTAATIAVGVIVGIAGVFLYRRNTSKKEDL